MDVMNVDTALSEEEEDNDDGIQRLVERLNLSEISTSGAEFAVQVNEDDALEQQTNYEGSSVFPHLNFNCLGPEDDGSDWDATYNIDQPFTYMASRMTNIIPNGKVKKRIVSEGYGEVVPENALVWFHHNSYYENQEEPFDSSYLRGPMTMLRLNSGRCIIGLDIGLSTMKRDEKAEFLIHPDLAYGKLGSPPRIPENAHILIIVEMKRFVDNSMAMKMEDFTEEELKSTPFEEIYKGALGSLFSGNRECSHKKHQTAIKFYKNGLRMLENCNMKTDDDDARNEALRLKLFTNLGVCYNTISRPKEAIVASQNALRLDPKRVKILYQLGLAHLNLGSFDEAKRYAFLARKYAPNNPDVSVLLQKIDKQLATYNANMVTFAKNAFKFAQSNSEKGSSKGNRTQVGSDIPFEKKYAKSPQNKYSSEVNIVEVTEEESQEIARGTEMSKDKDSALSETKPPLPDEEFQKETINLIKDFLDDPAEREMQLPFGLTLEEELFFKTQARLYDLRCENKQYDGRTIVFIFK